MKNKKLSAYEVYKKVVKEKLTVSQYKALLIENGILVLNKIPKEEK